MSNMQEAIDLLLKDYDKSWVLKTILNKTVRSKTPTSWVDEQMIEYEVQRELEHVNLIHKDPAFRRGSYGKLSYKIQEMLDSSITSRITNIVNELVDDGLVDAAYEDEQYNNYRILTLSNLYFEKEVGDFNLDETIILLRQLINEAWSNKMKIKASELKSLISEALDNPDEDIIRKIQVKARNEISVALNTIMNSLDQKVSKKLRGKKVSGIAKNISRPPASGPYHTDDVVEGEFTGIVISTLLEVDDMGAPKLSAVIDGDTGRMRVKNIEHLKIIGRAK